MIPKILANFCINAHSDLFLFNAPYGILDNEANEWMSKKNTASNFSLQYFHSDSPRYCLLRLDFCIACILKNCESVLKQCDNPLDSFYGAALQETLLCYCYRNEFISVFFCAPKKRCFSFFGSMASNRISKFFLELIFVIIFHCLMKNFEQFFVISPLCHKTM